jgi:hypothetical protein
MFYAVNVADMTRYSHDVGLSLLVLPVIMPERQEPTRENIAALEKLDCEPGRFDGMAVRLLCSEERAAAIVSVIRTRIKKHSLRFYQSKTGQGGWKRV